MEAFSTFLNVEACRLNASAPGVFVADLRFPQALSLLCGESKIKFDGCKLFHQYVGAFRRNGRAYHTLLFPAHVGDTENGHWVDFCVDFVKHEFSYGVF